MKVTISVSINKKAGLDSSFSTRSFALAGSLLVFRLSLEVDRREVHSVVGFFLDDRFRLHEPHRWCNCFNHHLLADLDLASDVPQIGHFWPLSLARDLVLRIRRCLAQQLPRASLPHILLLAEKLFFIYNLAFVKKSNL